jgi:hypothetical protein
MSTAAYNRSIERIDPPDIRAHSGAKSFLAKEADSSQHPLYRPVRDGAHMNDHDSGAVKANMERDPVM